MGTVVKFEKRKKVEKPETSLRWWSCLLGHHWGPWFTPSTHYGVERDWIQRRTCSVCGKERERWV